MGKSAAWQVAWNTDQARYQIHEQAGQSMTLSELDVDRDTWQEWLGKIPSFYFQSKDGLHVTVLKEQRARGRDYWIAYRKIDGKLKRKYLGASQEVTPTGLEQVAVALAQQETASPPPPLISLTPASTRNSMNASSEQLHEPLLTTKFLAPVPSHALIHRPRLDALLNEGVTRPLTLVSAPAGFGKTSLLESWVQSTSVENLRVAWVTLDEADNDVVRFWTYVLTALDRCEPGISQHALTLLCMPQAPALEYVLTTLMGV